MPYEHSLVILGEYVNPPDQYSIMTENTAITLGDFSVTQSQPLNPSLAINIFISTGEINNYSTFQKLIDSSLELPK